MPAVTTPAIHQVLKGSSLRRCTEVVSNIEGLALDICTAGRTAALHISTREGRVVVRLPLVELLTKIAAGHDANGVPFHLPESVEQVLERDAEATAPKLQGVARPARRKGAEIRATCEAIWEKLVANPFQNLDQLATAHGLNPSSLHYWISVNRPGGITQLRGTNVRVPAAVGLAAQAAQGLPLTKPSAASL